MSQTDPIKLYWTDISHPSQAARAMLELKGLDYKLVNVLPLSQRVHMRALGFRGGTVPALKLGPRRVQGSRRIARALDAEQPDPPLFPADPAGRSRVEEAERWGEVNLQPVPRRLARWAGARQPEFRRWVAAHNGLPLASIVAVTSLPLTRYYGRTLELDGRRADDAGVRTDLRVLPSLLDHVDALIADGTLTLAPPNAATLQILSSVRFLDALPDLEPMMSGRDCVAASRDLFPGYPGPFPARLPTEWMTGS